MLAYRTRRTVVFLQSNFSHERHDHLFFAWSVMPVQGEEIRDTLIATGANLTDMVDRVNRWEDEH